MKKNPTLAAVGGDQIPRHRQRQHCFSNTTTELLPPPFAGDDGLLPPSDTSFSATFVSSCQNSHRYLALATPPPLIENPLRYCCFFVFVGVLSCWVGVQCLGVLLFIINFEWIFVTKFKRLRLVSGKVVKFLFYLALLV